MKALLSSKWASGLRFNGRIAQFAARRQHLVNHGSQRGVNHVPQATAG
jgi:hypothetical protein